eukprot:403342976
MKVCGQDKQNQNIEKHTTTPLLESLNVEDSKQTKNYQLHFKNQQTSNSNPTNTAKKESQQAYSGSKLVPGNFLINFSHPKLYILFALSAAFFMGSSLIIRANQSGNIYVTNFMISMAFLIAGIIYLAVQYNQHKRMGYSGIQFPWMINKNLFVIQEVNLAQSQGIIQNNESRKNFSLYIFSLLFVGGIIEFMGSLVLSASFYFSGKAKINQGISGAMVSCNTIFIVIGSAIMYRERINLPQLVGILMMMLSVSVVSVFKAHHHFPENTPNLDQHAEESLEMYKYAAVATGLIASFVFGVQILFIKSLAKFGITGLQAAFYYVLFGGVIGLGCLIVALILEPAYLKGFRLMDFIFCLLIGFCIVCGQISINIAVQIGNSGISVAIMHTKNIIVTLFSYFVYKQDISMGQSIGIGLTFIGGVVIALEQKLNCVKDSQSKKQIK